MAVQAAAGGADEQEDGQSEPPPKWVPRVVGYAPVKGECTTGGRFGLKVDAVPLPPPDPLEACLELVACCCGPAPCLLLARRWRRAALRRCRSLRVEAAIPRLVLLAAVRARTELLSLDLCRCEAVCSDTDLAALSELFRKRTTKLRSLRLTGLGALTARSRRSLRCTGATCWAFSASQVETGCVLLSRPHAPAHEALPHFVRAAVLVLRHEAAGTLGLILNKATVLQVSGLVAESPEAPWSPAFDSCDVFCGGDRGRDITLLHGCRELGGAEIAEGVFVTCDHRVFARASDFVRWGKLSSSNTRWFLGATMWSPEEFQHEVSNGFWQVIHCDSHYMLPHTGSGDMLWSDLHTLTS